MSFAQILIAATSCVALALIATDSIRSRRWGFLIALLGQPAWISEAWRTNQHGVLLVALIYTVIYVWAVVKYFGAGKRLRRE